MKTVHFTLLVGIAAFIIGCVMYMRQTHAEAPQSFVLTLSRFDTEPGVLPSSAETTLYAVRNDGSFVIQPLTGLGSDTRHIIDFTAKRITHVVDSIQVKSTMKGVGPERAILLAARCLPEANEEDIVVHPVADGTILGVPVQRSEVFIVSKAGEIASEPHQMKRKTWMAPSLGCMTLREEETLDKWENGAWRPDSTQTQQAVSLSFQSVDDYFAIPTNYTEKAWGDAMLLRWQHNPRGFPQPRADTVKRQNDSYYAAQ